MTLGFEWQVGLDQGGVIGIVEDQQIARLAAEPAADGSAILVLSLSSFSGRSRISASSR